MNVCFLRILPVDYRPMIGRCFLMVTVGLEVSDSAIRLFAYTQFCLYLWILQETVGYEVYGGRYGRSWTS